MRLFHRLSIAWYSNVIIRRLVFLFNLEFLHCYKLKVPPHDVGYDDFGDRFKKIGIYEWSLVTVCLNKDGIVTFGNEWFITGEGLLREATHVIKSRRRLDRPADRRVKFNSAQFRCFQLRWDQTACDCLLGVSICALFFLFLFLFGEGRNHARSEIPLSVERQAVLFCLRGRLADWSDFCVFFIFCSRANQGVDSGGFINGGGVGAVGKGGGGRRCLQFLSSFSLLAVAAACCMTKESSDST